VDNQLLISNQGGATIIAEDDGIEVQNGSAIPYLTGGGAEQKVQNVRESTITAKDNGIQAGNFTVVYNDSSSTITADSDGSYWNDATGGSDGSTKPAGINVKNQNTVLNEGTINGNGDGIRAGNLNGFGWGSIVNGEDGVIDVGGNGIQVGSQNEVTNDGHVTGDVNGLLVKGGTMNIITNNGTLTGGGNGVNGGHSDGAGLNFTSSSNNTFLGSDGVITSQVGSGGDGIQINSSLNNSIIAGSVTGDDDGVSISSSSQNGLITGAITGRNGDGVVVDASNNNSVLATGDIKGGDNGVNLNNSSNITVTTTGGITGVDGDGVTISGGGNNVVSAVGAISGDPGVVISNSSNNQVSGSSITGTNGGVVITNGDNNTVKATSGGINGGNGVGVGIDGSSNVVSAAGNILGTNGSNGGDGVHIEGDSNIVKTTAGGHITGYWDGVQINGSNNSVTSAGGVTGENAEGVQIDGTANTVTVGGDITSNWTGGSGDAGVDVSGTGNTVTATGHIHGTNGAGVIVDGTNNTVSANQYIHGYNGDGATISGTGNHVSSNSSIDGSADGVNISGSGNFANAASVSGEDSGVVLGGTGGHNVTVTGAIVGYGDEGLSITSNSNIVKAGSIQGYWDGIDINAGNNNQITVTGAGGVTGLNGDGVDIYGLNNSVLVQNGGITGDDDGVAIKGIHNSVVAFGDIQGGAAGVNISGNNNSVAAANGADIKGGDVGVVIDGSNNQVNADDITGQGGNGVTVSGNQNTVEADGTVKGTAGGIQVTGNLNQLSANDVVSTGTGPGDVFGIGLKGDQNRVDIANDVIVTAGKVGVGISGNQNTVHVGDEISNTGGSGMGGVGAAIGGNQNTLTADDITARTVGLYINGDDNTVDIGSTITSGFHGVWIDSGTDNTVDLRGVTINAGGDGVHLDEPGNTIQHDASTSITAGDDGIEFEYGGLVNAYESLVWLGTINAKDDGIVTDGNFFTIINNGTINGDTDKSGVGNGIHVKSNNTVENAGTLSGANGIQAIDNNTITNDLGATITASIDGINAGNNNTVKNDGTITAGDDGIQVGNNNTVTNNGNLSIHAKDDGIVAGDSNTITNNGLIEADSDKNSVGNGIKVNNSNTVTNASGGSILGWNGIVGNNLNTITNASGASITVTNNGIDVAGQNTVTNGGTITANNIGVNGLDENEVTNTGTITAYNVGVNVRDYNTVENKGTISGTKAGSIGIAVEYDNTVTNYSTVTALSAGIYVGEDYNTVTNTGTVSGTASGGDGVRLGTGGSAYENTLNNNAGSITGNDNGVEVSGYYNDINNAYGATITGTNGDGVRVLTGYANVVTNNGSISGGNDGVGFDSGSNRLNNYNSVVGYNDGADLSGGYNWVYNYSGTIRGTNGDGIDATGDYNYIQNSYGALIVGKGDGVYVYGSEGTGIDNYGTITGTTGDGIEFESSTESGVYNTGTITGAYDGIDNWIDEESSKDGSLTVTNYGTITGTADDGIYTEGPTTVNNYGSGLITGGYDGIHADYGAALTVYNGEDATIRGVNGAGIYTWSDGEYSSDHVTVYNAGLIQGGNYGIHNEGNSDVYVANYSTGLITGSEAGYIYEDSSYQGPNARIQIDNAGIIEVTGQGTLPTPVAQDQNAAVNLDMINGEGASPVAAIDTRGAGADVQAYIFNWGQINGANVFGDNPATEEVETDFQLTNRFAILGGEGAEFVANFAGGTINGDIALQGGNDVVALEIGSTVNGSIDLGQTLGTADVLGIIADTDPETEGNQPGVGFVTTNNVDTGVDTVVLFGQGYQDVAGDITEAEILYVNDRLTQADVYSVGPHSNVVLSTQPVLENQPFPAGTWSLNGNVTVDGTNRWTEVAIDTNGDGTTDTSVPMVTGTIATVVDNGRLNIGGTILVEVPPADQESDPTYKYEVQKSAVLTSPVVDVWSGGTLGGHGTIVTNPGANGGNGGVNLSGAVQGEQTIVGGVDPAHAVSQTLPSEARGSLIIGTTTGDLVTQDETGKVTDATKGDGTPDFKIVPAADAESEPTTVDLQYTVDANGKLYPAITLPVGFVEEVGPSAFDFTTDKARYATIAPGDEITRIGKLTVYGNVTMDGYQTATTQYKVARQDNPATASVDESKDADGNQIYDLQNARTVVTNWGSQFQADLKANGEGDQLLVKKTGVTSAITGYTVDTTGKGTVDLITQDATGAQTAATGDGVPDFDIVDTVKVNRLVNGAGGADGVADGIAYKVSTVLDGHATVNGRLDIRLDGEFVDQVTNGQPATIVDPNNTGCGDAPDSSPSCIIPNPAYKVPDGIADVDSKGIATPTADFTKNAKVWDVIVAEGGVTGKFQTLGFDGGPNDGAVVVRYDDPTTAANEEVRVQLLKAYLQYLPDRVRIISIPNFKPKGTTLNQTLTGEYLDSLSKYGLQTDSLQGLIALVGTASNIPAALDALHPEWYNAFNEVGFSIARGAEQQAYIRTIEAQGFSGGEQNRVVMNVGDDSAVGSSASDKRASFWLAGSWGNSNVSDGKHEGWLEYKYETLTGYAGFDYLINPNLLVGILGGFSNSKVDPKNGTGNKGDVDTWQVGGYVSYFTNSWFLNAGGGYGDMKIDSIRNIDFGSAIGSVSEVADAKYNGNITYFYGKGGYNFDLGGSGWKLSPELALSYVKVKQDAFSETGTGNAPGFLLNVDQQSVESVRGTAQLRLSKTFLAGNGGGWMPYARVGIANEFEHDLRPITSGFQGAPGTQFTVFGQVPRQTTVIFGAGVTGKVSESFSLYLDYSGEIGGSFSEHVVSGGARFHF
jgi:hypothetical protein